MPTNTIATLPQVAVELMQQAVIISGTATNKIDEYVTIKTEEMASTIPFTVFSRLAEATTPLVDGTQASSETMSASQILLTPKEYGKVLTTTTLLQISSSGKTDLASAELVGINMGETTDKLGVTALEASANSTTVITLGELTKEDLRAAYTKLSTEGVVKFDDNRYVAFMNPNQISDLKDDFIAIVQNTNSYDATSGVVGALEGFTIIEDSKVSDGTVSCFGRNALGKGTSKMEGLVLTDGNDNLGRTVNVGWYGVFEYKIIDEVAIQIITGA